MIHTETGSSSGPVSSFFKKERVPYNSLAMPMKISAISGSN